MALKEHLMLNTSEEEAQNEINFALENMHYDIGNGCSEFVALERALDQMGVESTFEVEFMEMYISYAAEHNEEIDDDEDDTSFQYPEGFWDIWSPKAENVAIIDTEDHYEVVIPDEEEPDNVRVEYYMCLEDVKECLDKTKMLWTEDEKNVWIVLNVDGKNTDFHKQYTEDSWKELVNICKERYLVLSGQQQFEF